MRHAALVPPKQLAQGHRMPRRAEGRAGARRRCRRRTAPPGRPSRAPRRRGRPWIRSAHPHVLPGPRVNAGRLHIRRNARGVHLTLVPALDYGDRPRRPLRNSSTRSFRARSSAWSAFARSPAGCGSRAGQREAEERNHPKDNDSRPPFGPGTRPPPLGEHPSNQHIAGERIGGTTPSAAHDSARGGSGHVEADPRSARGLRAPRRRGDRS